MLRMEKKTHPKAAFDRNRARQTFISKEGLYNVEQKHKGTLDNRGTQYP